MDSLQDILRFADQFKNFHNAERMAVGAVLNVYDALYNVFLSPTMLLAVSLVALSWFVMRLDYQRGFMWFIYLGFAMAMTYPITVDNPGGTGTIRVSAALWYFNELTTDLVKLAEGGVDKGLGRKKNGDVGNFAASTAALSSVVKSYAPEGTQLEQLNRDYINNCSSVITDAKNSALQVKLMDVLYPHNGRLGYDWDTWASRKNAAPPEHTKFTELPSEIKLVLEQVPVISPLEMYTIESYDGMKRYYAGDKKDVELLMNPSPEKFGYYKKGDTPADNTEAERVKYKYKPTNCYEMFQLVDLGWRQVNRAAQDTSETVASSLLRDFQKNVTPGRVFDVVNTPLKKFSDTVADTLESLGGMQACVVSLPRLTASLNAHTLHKKSASGGTKADYVGSSGNALTATGIVEWFEEWSVIIATLVIPAAAALAMAGVFIIYPIVLGASLVPGRESTIGTLFLTIIFIKMAVFFSYAILSAGGYITTAAICSMAYTPEYAAGATNLTASYRGIAAAGMIVTYLGALGGGLWLAKTFTFNDRATIGTMGLGKFGAKQMLSAAMTVASAVGATRAVGGAASGLSKITTAASSAAKNAAPSTTATNTKTNAATSDATRPPTHNELLAKTKPTNRNKELRSKKL